MHPCNKEGYYAIWLISSLTEGIINPELLIWYVCSVYIFHLIFVYNFISNKEDGKLNSKRKRLRPGKVSPRLTVPDHIMRPPYVGSRQSPQISSGPEIHEEKGIECMRASGRLAAQVLEYAGTLVKVMYTFLFVISVALWWNCLISIKIVFGLLHLFLAC